MLLKRPLATLDPARLLDAVVVKNAAVRLEQRAGAVVLWVPLERRWWMGPPFSWLLPFRKEKGVELDALGQEVFSECDGERRVEEVIERFAARHRVRFHEARHSVVQFLALLFERKLVTLRVAEDAVVPRSSSSPRSPRAPRAPRRKGRS
jgi:hypothetical protein